MRNRQRACGQLTNTPIGTVGYNGSVPGPRDSFELTKVYGKPTAGIRKDVVLVKGFGKIEVDVTPAMDGLTLFRCHQQLHMDSVSSRCSTWFEANP